MDDRGVALIVGAGDATGGAIARRFAREGFTVCVVRRKADSCKPLVAQIEADGGRARAFGSDARREEQVVALIEEIERDIGPIEVFVFNIGANVAASILEETARKYFKIWEMACFAGFLTAREVAKRMVARERGTMLFTGATASLRGSARFAAFAGAKHALRALAQSLSRASWGRRTFMSPIQSSMGRSTPPSFARTFPSVMRSRTRTASSIRRISPTPTGTSTPSHATPGPSNSTCGPGWNAGESSTY